MASFKWFNNKKKKIFRQYTLSDKFEGRKRINGVCFFCVSLNDFPNAEDRQKLEEIAKKNNQEVEWLQSIISEKEERLKETLMILSQNRTPFWLKRNYDYAWIKLAIDRGLVPNLKTFKSISPNAFFQIIRQLEQPGLKALPDESEFRKYYKKANYGTFPWYYADCNNNDGERTRRNGIVRRFKELMEA